MTCTYWRVQGRVTEIRGLEHLSYERGMRELEHLLYEMLRELRLFRLERMWLRGLLIDMYKYLTRKSKIDRARLFSVKTSDSTSGSRCKLEWRKFHLTIRNNFLL